MHGRQDEIHLELLAELVRVLLSKVSVEMGEVLDAGCLGGVTESAQGLVEVRVGGVDGGEHGRFGVAAQAFFEEPGED